MSRVCVFSFSLCCNWALLTSLGRTFHLASSLGWIYRTICINLIFEAVVTSYKRTDLTGTGYLFVWFFDFVFCCCCFSGANLLRPLSHITTLSYVDSCLFSTKPLVIMSYLVANQGTIQPKSEIVLATFSQTYPWHNRLLTLKPELLTRCHEPNKNDSYTSKGLYPIISKST